MFYIFQTLFVRLYVICQTIFLECHSTSFYLPQIIPFSFALRILAFVKRYYLESLTVLISVSLLIALWHLRNGCICQCYILLPNLCRFTSKDVHLVVFLPGLCKRSSSCSFRIFMASLRFDTHKNALINLNLT